MDPQHGGKKRPSPELSRTFYPRKRALVACEVCRRRKSKCDNARPACGACRGMGIECAYRDQRSDHSTYDLASLEILDRVSHVAELVEAQGVQLAGLLSGSVAGSHNSPSLPSSLGNIQPSDQGSGASPSSGSQASRPRGDPAHRWCAPRDEAALHSESLGAAETNTGTCEDILEWPIFGGRFRRSETETLIFNPDHGDSPRDPGSSAEADGARPRPEGGRGVREEDVLGLVGEFLANVHIKNPILDVDDIWRKAKDVVECGFRWNAPSCLVLVTSALGSLSSPYTPERITTEHRPQCSNSVEDASGYATAEGYYVAAQKRVGLLKPSIVALQCFFLSGVYEMYSLRPQRAWSSFNRACVALQTYLRGKTSRTGDAAEDRLERRLYWSCLKSECEMRMEVSLPSSGLARVNYPDHLPTPPGGSSPGQPLDEDSIGAPASPLTTEQERSWCYYLSDIAVRRIANRVVNWFYQEKQSAWLSVPVEEMVRAAEELQLQLTQWHDSVPELVAGPSPPSPGSDSSELQLLIQGRLLNLRPHIYLPFLYLTVHQPASWPGRAAIEPYARRCIDACLETAQRGVYRHRHHGTWYGSRCVFSMALLVLAAVKSGRVTVPPVWRTAVETAIVGLGFWEREAPDLGRARMILQAIVDDINSETGAE